MLTAADWERTVAAARPVTFEVFNHGCNLEATGSAVAVAPDLLVTNRHVVAGARTMEVRPANGQRTAVDSWTVSKRDDLALLRLHSPVTSTPMTLSTDPTPGDLVAALGYPLGGPLTAGIGRVVDVGHTSRSKTPMITASMDVLPGNSGGPVVNTDGALVGLVRAIDLSEGWTIAVPVDRIEDLLDNEGSTPGEPCR